jgi:hypothetical protein
MQHYCTVGQKERGVSGKARLTSAAQRMIQRLPCTGRDGLCPDDTSPGSQNYNRYSNFSHWAFSMDFHVNVFRGRLTRNLASSEVLCETTSASSDEECQIERQCQKLRYLSESHARLCKVRTS